MGNPPSLEVGLRYNERATLPGAQTVRPAVAKAGEWFASRLTLTGRFLLVGSR